MKRLIRDLRGGMAWKLLRWAIHMMPEGRTKIALLHAVLAVGKIAEAEAREEFGDAVVDRAKNGQ